MSIGALRAMNTMFRMLRPLFLRAPLFSSEGIFEMASISLLPVIMMGGTLAHLKPA